MVIPRIWEREVLEVVDARISNKSPQRPQLTKMYIVHSGVHGNFKDWGGRCWMPRFPTKVPKSPQSPQLTKMYIVHSGVHGNSKDSSKYPHLQHIPSYHFPFPLQSPMCWSFPVYYQSYAVVQLCNEGSRMKWPRAIQVFCIPK
jgi:hypothetical protein